MTIMVITNKLIFGGKRDGMANLISWIQAQGFYFSLASIDHFLSRRTNWSSEWGKFHFKIFGLPNISTLALFTHNKATNKQAECEKCLIFAVFQSEGSRNPLKPTQGPEKLFLPGSLQCWAQPRYELKMVKMMIVTSSAGRAFWENSWRCILPVAPSTLLVFTAADGNVKSDHHSINMLMEHVPWSYKM